MTISMQNRKNTPSNKKHVAHCCGWTDLECIPDYASQGLCNLNLFKNIIILFNNNNFGLKN